MFNNYHKVNKNFVEEGLEQRKIPLLVRCMLKRVDAIRRYVAWRSKI
jgi:hypothetical protein